MARRQGKTPVRSLLSDRRSMGLVLDFFRSTRVDQGRSCSVFGYALGEEVPLGDQCCLFCFVSFLFFFLVFHVSLGGCHKLLASI